MIPSPSDTRVESLLASTSRARTSHPQPCFQATNEINYEHMARFCAGAAFVGGIDLTGQAFCVSKPRRQGGLATRRAIFWSVGGGGRELPASTELASKRSTTTTAISRAAGWRSGRILSGVSVLAAVVEGG